LLSKEKPILDKSVIFDFFEAHKPHNLVFPFRTIAENFPIQASTILKETANPSFSLRQMDEFGIALIDFAEGAGMTANTLTTRRG